MPYARQIDGQWAEITGPFATDAASYPPGWVDGATPDELAAAGVVAVTNGQLDPSAHQRKTGEEIADVGGVPTRQGIFEEITLAERQAATLEAIRAARFAHEQGGFTSPQGRQRTDDATQAKVTGAVAYFNLLHLTTAEPPPVDWELAPGDFVSVSMAQVQAMALAIGGHVQACFTRSRQLSEAVMAATQHADLTSIDIESGWPS